MSMRPSIPNRFRQLRWKLMLSYTGVTVGAILVISLFAAAAANIWLDNQLQNTDLPYQLVEKAAAGYVNELRPILNQSPPDQKFISSFIERVETSSTMILLGAIPVVFDPGELQLQVVDSQGVLLGATSDAILEDSIIHEFLDTQEIPQLSQTLQAALEEGENPPGWQRKSISDDVVIVAPVWDLAWQHVLGALVVSFKVPTATSLVGEFVSDIIPDMLMITMLAGVIGTFFGFLFGRGLNRRLNQLADATIAWSQGNFTVYVDDPSEDELGQLAQRLNHMARRLEQLLDTRSDLMVVEERNRMARDLHDSAKQQAFAAAAQISAARKLFLQDPGAAETHIEEAERLIDDLRKELTNLIEELRPAALEDKGLASALRTYAQDWSRQNGLELRVSTKHERPIPLDVEQMIFRIIQEALSNVSRHSQASNAEIRLVYDQLEITCTISDDGIGFDPKKKPSGFGIRSMQERANSIGSMVTIESTPDHGTCITFTVPL